MIKQVYQFKHVKMLYKKLLEFRPSQLSQFLLGLKGKMLDEINRLLASYSFSISLWKDTPDVYGFKVKPVATYKLKDLSKTRLLYKLIIPLTYLVKDKIDSSSLFVYDTETVLMPHSHDPNIKQLELFMISYGHFKLDEPVSKDDFSCITISNKEEIDVGINSFIKFVLDKTEAQSNNRAFIWAHNFSGFDSYIILGHLLNCDLLDWSSNRAVHHNNKFYKVVVQSHSGITLNFLCSLLLIPNSLKNLCGVWLGESVKIDFPAFAELTLDNYLNNTKPTWEQVRRKWEAHTWEAWKCELSTTYGGDILTMCQEYCINDSFALARIIRAFLSKQKKFFLGKLNTHYLLTAPRLSIGKFLQSFYNPYGSPLALTVGPKELMDIIRDSYHGGRCENFVLFKNKADPRLIYHFDVPGMYARRIQKSLPIGDPARVGSITSSNFSVWIKKLRREGKYCGFFNVLVTAPSDLHIPLLSVKDPDSGKLLFPRGKWKGSYYSSELFKALDLGYEFVLLGGWLYHLGEPLKRFSEVFTQIKEAASTAGDTVAKYDAKLAINSLYGKFAQDIDNVDTRLFQTWEQAQAYAEAEAAATITYGHFSSFGGAWGKFESIKTPVKYVNNMALASAITAESRVLWYEIYEHLKVVIPSCEIIYTDTDRFFVISETDPTGIKLPDGIVWQTDGCFTHGIALAPKFYVMLNEVTGHKIVLKGASISKNTPLYEHLVKKGDELSNCKEISKEYSFSLPQIYLRKSIGEGGGIQQVRALKTFKPLSRPKRSFVELCGGLGANRFPLHFQPPIGSINPSRKWTNMLEVVSGASRDSLHERFRKGLGVLEWFPLDKNSLSFPFLIDSKEVGYGFWLERVDCWYLELRLYDIDIENLRTYSVVFQLIIDLMLNPKQIDFHWFRFLVNFDSFTSSNHIRVTAGQTIKSLLHRVILNIDSIDCTPDSFAKEAYRLYVLYMEEYGEHVDFDRHYLMLRCIVEKDANTPTGFSYIPY